MPEVASIDAALERIKSGNQTTADLEVLGRALARGQRSVAIGGSAEGSVIVTGDGNTFTLQGPSADVLRKVLGDIQSHATLNPRERRDRSRMLQRVRRTWIDGYLEDSLHGAALQALGLEARPDAVPGRWGMVLQELDRPARAVPSDTSLVQVYDDLDGELLILGEPGSGKTTLLLELTRALLDRAERDEALPIPVVFLLASWANKRLPLADWLADELNERYDVPRKIASGWVADDRILPLLDGLDEVAAEHQIACVAAINAFREERAMDLLGVVVTSRVAEYDAVATQLRLRGAVLLQPLRPEQIDAYLDSAGQQLAGVRAALQADAVLRDLASSPLLLSTMTVAYQDVPARLLPKMGTAEERRTQVFRTYVEVMLARRRVDTRYTKEQVLHWLGWLARALSREAQTIIYLEHLQPDWLTTRGVRLRYALLDRLGSALVLGLVGGLTCGVLGLLLFELIFAINVGLRFGSPTGQDVGITGAVSIGLPLAMAGSLLGGLFGGASIIEFGHRQRLWPAIRRSVLGWLLGGLTFGLVFSLVIDKQVALVGGLIFGLPFALAAGLTGRPAVSPRRIAVVETIRWSNSGAVSLGLGGLVVGTLAAGVVDGLLAGLYAGLQFAVISGLFGGLGAGLVSGSIFGLVGGLAGREVDTRVSPNQGIRRSARTAVSVGLPFGLVFGLAGGVVFAQDLTFVVPAPFVPGGAIVLGLPFGWLFGLEAGLVDGLVVGLVVGLAFGGYACLSHLALRLVLWRADALPLDAIDFLDYATERIFLRRVGGGYIFVHRLMQEYFAAFSTEVSAEASSGRPHERVGVDTD